MLSDYIFLSKYNILKYLILSLGQQQRYQSHNFQHQSVTRIASAPDSYKNWKQKINNNLTRSPQSIEQITCGISDSQYNKQHFLPSTNSTNLQNNLSFQETRNRLQYHLINIFPKEQVQVVMSMYPDEIDPQKICATILAMFPKH